MADIHKECRQWFNILILAKVPCQDWRWFVEKLCGLWHQIYFSGDRWWSHVTLCGLRSARTSNNLSWVSLSRDHRSSVKFALKKKFTMVSVGSADFESKSWLWSLYLEIQMDGNVMPNRHLWVYGIHAEEWRGISVSMPLLIQSCWFDWLLFIRMNSNSLWGCDELWEMLVMARSWQLDDRNAYIFKPII